MSSKAKGWLYSPSSLICNKLTSCHFKMTCTDPSLSKQTQRIVLSYDNDIVLFPQSSSSLKRLWSCRLVSPRKNGSVNHSLISLSSYIYCNARKTLAVSVSVARGQGGQSFLFSYPYCLVPCLHWIWWKKSSLCQHRISCVPSVPRNASDPHLTLRVV